MPPLCAVSDCAVKSGSPTHSLTNKTITDGFLFFLFIFEKKIMKKLRTIILFIGLGLVFAGCPYSSEVPIDMTASIPVDQTFIGKWEPTSSSDYYYVVGDNGDNKYKITKKSISTGDETIYLAYESKIEGVSYLSIYEDGATENIYYFYRLTKKGNYRFMLEPVTENIDETFTTSAELKAFLQKHQNTSFLFDRDADEYVRMEN